MLKSHISVDMINRNNYDSEILDKGFIDNKFVSCEELFPYWITARIILKSFCDKVKMWEVTSYDTVLEISLKYPLVMDELSKEMVPQVLLFPEEDRDKVIGIIDKLQFDYTPKMEDFLYRVNNEELKYNILNILKIYEHSIIRLEGRPILEELKFRLGVLL